jgi:CspA family cold shock protein
METLRRYGLVELVPGQTVLVRYGPGPKGLMAAEIHLEQDVAATAAH